MRKLLLPIVMLVFVVSCTQENEQLGSDSNLAKNSSNVSELYFDLLANHFNSSEDFDNLPVETKLSLYEFKYYRFLAENTLTSSQAHAVENLIVHIQNLEVDEELELSNQNIIEIFSNFDLEQGTFLLGHLGNSVGDYNPPTQTEGCWWCFRRTVTEPCHEEFVDGESIGFYQTETMLRHGIFGIRNSSRDLPGVLMPCD